LFQFSPTVFVISKHSKRLLVTHLQQDVWVMHLYISEYITVQVDSIASDDADDAAEEAAVFIISPLP